MSYDQKRPEHKSTKRTVDNYKQTTKINLIQVFIPKIYLLRLQIMQNFKIYASQ